MTWARIRSEYIQSLLRPTHRCLSRSNFRSSSGYIYETDQSRSRFPGKRSGSKKTKTKRSMILTKVMVLIGFLMFLFVFGTKIYTPLKQNHHFCQNLSFFVFLLQGPRRKKKEKRYFDKSDGFA